ncbi:MAG: protein kinase [Blastocatellia bacterium]
MTPERRQQIKQVFHDARECAPAARAAFLDDACRGDEALRQEVASLLHAYDNLGDFMQRPVLAATLAPELSQEQVFLQPGQQIGAYRIERHLGAGGMGVVYVARDTRLGRQVTLKLLPPRFTQDRERLRRFQQEARAASALNHPSLLTIYEVGQMDADAGGAYYIVAEFVQGQTLRELARDESLQLGAALDVAIQLTDALAAAHQAGIVHRDIKPENVMRRPDGIVKVLDFGLAKLTEFAERPPDLSFATVDTQPGLVIGTVAYMSPEQARGLAVDARSDLFSVGTVLYELLTGRKPFQGETQSDVLASLLEREPPPLSYYVAGLPASLQTIVTRALQKKPAERFQAAPEFSAALRQLKQELELAAHLGRAVSSVLPLQMKVGVGAQDEEVTKVLAASTGEQRSLLKLLSTWSARAPVLWLGAVAVALLVLGLLLGRYWWQARATAVNSIAVLPFANAGNDPQKEYLPDALTENLIESLSRLPALHVSSLSTVAAYKNRAVDAREAGNALHVRALLQGEVKWENEKLIVRVELVDAQDGSRLWGETYQPARTEILTTQTAIVREIAAKLHRRLSPENQEQLARRQTANSRAFDLYAQGRKLYFQDAYQHREQVLTLFGQALALDPGYALAYCGVADEYAELASQFLPASEVIPKARDAALKALELDESLPDAHLSLARIKLWGDWDWVSAEREYKRALELNPKLTRAHGHYYAGNVDRTPPLTDVCARSRSPIMTGFDFAMSGERQGRRCAQRHYDRALSLNRNLLELDPKNSGLHESIALLLSLKGQHHDALAQLRRWEPHPQTYWLGAYS